MIVKLYVGNVPFSATEADVRAFLAPYRVIRATVCADAETGRPRGFAFAEVEGDLDEVVGARDGADFGGRRAVVREAIDKRSAGEVRASRG